jgi:hypothetical protein
MDANGRRGTKGGSPPDAQPQVSGSSWRWSRRKIALVVAVVAVVAIVLIAWAFISPLKGIIAQAYLHNGDYILYDVEGDSILGDVTGTVRIEISNVTIDGFTATMTSSGVPFLNDASYDYSWDDPVWGDMGLGAKVNTTNIETPWGQKTVDVYFADNSSGKITTYLGTNPQVVYRLEVDAFLYTLIAVISDTNIEIIKSGNG